MGGNSDMPGMSYDSRLDYYEALGVGRDATGEELKQAHVELALKYHPDVAAGGDTAANNSHFRAIQDAFTVLGNPVTRLLYNEARFGASPNALGGLGASSSSSAVPDDSYTMQKANYVNVRRNASSNWREIKDKYKTERWQNTPLTERKRMRVKPVMSGGGGLVSIALPWVAGVVALAAVFEYSKPKHLSRR